MGFDNQITYILFPLESQPYYVTSFWLPEKYQTHRESDIILLCFYFIYITLTPKKLNSVKTTHVLSINICERHKVNK